MDPFTDFSPEDIEATLGDNCELDYFLEEKDLFPAFLDQLFSGNSFFTPENLSGPCKSSSSGVDRIDDILPLSSMPEQLNDKSPCTSNHKNKIPSLAARRLQYKKNLLAEKRRRETLNKQFIALSTLLPGITKTDRISIMGEALKYINQLKGENNKLKQYNANQAVVMKKSQVHEEQHSCSITKSSSVCSDEQLPEIEVRMYEKKILLTIRCEKEKDVLANILSEIEKLNLTVISGNIMPFVGITYEIIIVAEMDNDFSISQKNLVKRLHSAHFLHKKLNSTIRKRKNIHLRCEQLPKWGSCGGGTS